MAVTLKMDEVCTAQAGPFGAPSGPETGSIYLSSVQDTLNLIVGESDDLSIQAVLDCLARRFKGGSSS